MSEKRTQWNSTLPAPSAPLKRNKPINPINRKRRMTEFARCYGSGERVQKIKNLPCCVPGCTAHQSENAHLGNEGKGRKSHWSKVVPLCGDFFGRHHSILDIDFAGDIDSFDATFQTDLRRVAARLAEEVKP